MNIPLVILWTIVIICAILLTVSVSLYSHKMRQDYTITIESGSKACPIQYNTAVDIETLPCCVVGTSKTASRYVPSLDMVVNPVEIPYLPVCQGYCSEGVTADGMKCVNGVGQADFDYCIEISRPKNCTDITMPVAYVGITPYYPNSATDAACVVTTTC